MVVSRRAFSLLSAVNTIKFLIINCVTSVQEKTHSTQIIGICKIMKKPHKLLCSFFHHWKKLFSKTTMKLFNKFTSGYAGVLQDLAETEYKLLSK